MDNKYANLIGIVSFEDYTFKNKNFRTKIY